LRKETGEVYIRMENREGVVWRTGGHDHNRREKEGEKGKEKTESVEKENNLERRRRERKKQRRKIGDDFREKTEKKNRQRGQMRG